MKTNCIVCGKEIDRPPAHIARSKNGIFCSHACHGRWQQGENNHAYTGGLVKRSCEVCGKAFRVKPCRIRKGGGRYCSKECQAVAYRLNPPRARTTIIVRCDFCGSDIERKPSMVSATNFCSRTCANLYHRLRMRGKGNPHYVHGNSPEEYSAEYRRVQPLVRVRDGNKCRKCGATCEECGKALTVHHVNCDKTDDRIENLVSLCQWCHSSMHGGEDIERKWAAYWSQQLNGSRPQSGFSISG